MTPEQQKAYYAKNKASAAIKEKAADYEAVGSRGDAARKGMEDGKMNPAGDTYKKGGKIMSKKSKRYDEGGDVETETTQGENKNIGDDTRARAMAAIAAGGVKDEEKPKAAPAKKKAAAKTAVARDRKLADPLAPKRLPDEPKPKAAPSFMMKSMGYDGGVKAAPSFMMKSMGYAGGGKVKKVAGKLATRGYGKARA